MKLFVLVMGMVFIVEGMPYFAFAERMKMVLQQLAEMEPGRLRMMGFASMLIGLLLCYLAQGTEIFG